MNRQRNRAFTLLEVMVALSLLLMAGGLVGWKMHRAVLNKRFQSDLERLKSRCFVCQRLAIATQTDWRGTLTKEKGRWIFQTYCVDSIKTKSLNPIRIGALSVSYNSKKVDEFTIDFFSTGQVLPEGTLDFFQNGGSNRKTWTLPEIFQRDVSKGLGPIHPNDI